MSPIFKSITCWLFTPMMFLASLNQGSEYSARRNGSTQSTEKPAGLKYKPILWHANNHLGSYVPYMDKVYISKMSSQEKAAVAFTAIFLDNTCNSESKESIKVHCSLIEALGLGKQCSPGSIQFLRYWFYQDKKSLKDLEGCQIVPSTATYQERLVDVSMAQSGELYLVKFTAAGLDLREMRIWQWKQIDRYLFRGNKMVKVDSRVLSKEEKNLEEPKNH
jgi:hypothetical protein